MTTSIKAKKLWANQKYREMMVRAHVGSNITHGQSKTRFYRTFERIKYRCDYKGATGYKNYGGRGIKCLWKSFEDFRNDMYASYVKHVEKHGEKETTIDRIDVDGNYCAENCQWATRTEQNNNQRIHKKAKEELAKLNGGQYCYGCNQVKGLKEFFKRKNGINKTERLCKPCYQHKYYKPKWENGVHINMG